MPKIKCVRSIFQIQKTCIVSIKKWLSTNVLIEGTYIYITQIISFILHNIDHHNQEGGVIGLTPAMILDQDNMHILSNPSSSLEVFFDTIMHQISYNLGWCILDPKKYIVQKICILSRGRGTILSVYTHIAVWMCTNK